jgi:hypothetical protein
MPPRRNPQPDIYVAKTSFHYELNGERGMVTAGERIRAGHALLRAQAEDFEPVDTTVHYDVPLVEQATAAPGERRG